MQQAGLEAFAGQLGSEALAQPARNLSQCGVPFAVILDDRCAFDRQLF